MMAKKKKEMPANPIALVTGASRGIGKAVALALGKNIIDMDDDDDVVDGFNLIVERFRQVVIILLLMIMLMYDNLITIRI